MRLININELHSVLLGIGKEFHRICVNNNIPYYMIGGTMLGAIRHHGFIPWDDDMDFGVPREYFEKLIECCKEQCQKPYSIISNENSRYLLGYFKLQDERTVIDDPIMKDYADQQVGINIDIFPLDTCSSDYSRLKWHDRRRIMFDHIGNGIFLRLPKRKWYYGMINKLLRTLLPNGMKAKAIWIKIKNYLCELYSRTGDDAMINLYGIYGKKELVKKEIWGTPKLYIFEDTQFYGPEDYDGFLSQIYRTYMELPPEDKRHVHVDSAYMK